jgi:hypothetical protein
MKQRQPEESPLTADEYELTDKQVVIRFTQPGMQSKLGGYQYTHYHVIRHGSEDTIQRFLSLTSRRKSIYIPRHITVPLN